MTRRRRTTMHRERLERSIGTLLAYEQHPFPGVTFNMRTWLSHMHADHETGPETNWCGTSACAAGLICMQPWAREAGLHFTKGETLCRYDPIFGDAIGWSALARFFDLD